MILFLDFDGVLHNEDVFLTNLNQAEIDALTESERRFLTKNNQIVTGTNLFEHAERLAAILAPYPNIKIVISSTWREHFTLDQIANILPPSLAKRVIGKTPELGFPNRAYEICIYAFEIKTPWIVLDDSALWWLDGQCWPNLFKCDSKKGLDESAGIEFSKFLQEFTS
jgi:hypothetical protein